MTAAAPPGATTTRTELFRLITTITDPQQASAAHLADCYHQRPAGGVSVAGRVRVARRNWAEVRPDLARVRDDESHNR